MIIRDWKILSTREWFISDKITYNNKYKDEIITWINELHSNNIINKLEIDLTDDEIISKRCNLYNIIYHVTLGLGSLNRESKENYPIFSEDINKYFDNLELYKKDIIWDNSYIKFVKKYITNYENKVLESENWIAPKELIILKK